METSSLFLALITSSIIFCRWFTAFSRPIRDFSINISGLFIFTLLILQSFSFFLFSVFTKNFWMTSSFKRTSRSISGIYSPKRVSTIKHNWGPYPVEIKESFQNPSILFTSEKLIKTGFTLDFNIFKYLKYISCTVA